MTVMTSFAGPSGWEDLKVPETSLRSLSLCSPSPAESIIHSDPVFNLTDNYFMAQKELYEAAMQKRFHMQMLAQRLGWQEDGCELEYACRCLLRGQPHQGRLHLGSPAKPLAPGAIFPNKGGTNRKPCYQVPLLSCLLPRLGVMGPYLQ
jgi:hypothetical protein